MHIFQIKSEREIEATVFARSHDHAAELYMAWRIVNGADMLLPHEVAEFDHARHQRHADEALSRGVAGIGHYDEQVGWTISPPEKFEEIADGL
ncbi:hypothetical protein CG471_07015 [Sphingobium sp. IP1]|uniref:hypothetical protein n=1 Tax=Sphingobium sp. IP1 TaxID=2021637 RepID=UPI000C06F05F|nr:hypothetical protein [Sphingobium sp. IP1]PHP20460.1 hypothetical protein CG471_07015 [Sphingobium sp. IP1]